MTSIGGYHWNKHMPDFAIVPQFEAREARLRSKPCTFGIELEIAGGGCNVTNGRKILNAMSLEEHRPNGQEARYLAAKDYLIWFSEDGSVTCGFEIITQPMSLKYHLTNMKWLEGFRKMEELGYSSWDSQSRVGCSCGLHCHVPRSYFITNTSNPEEVFTVVFSNLEKDLVRFSGRERSGLRWCRPFEEERFWSYKLKTEDQPEETARIEHTKNSASGCHDNRYHLVNFTNENTIEFRLFRGTTNYKAFVADLQLCYMLAEIGKRFTVEQACNVSWAYLRQYAQGLNFKEFLEIDKVRRSRN